MAEAPQFTEPELEQFEHAVVELQQHLTILQSRLDAGEEDTEIEPALARVNQQIFALRKKWRSMLQLPPPRE